MAKKSFIAQSGQSILDLSIIAYGNSEDVLRLMGENPGLNLNAKTYAGTKINYTESTADQVGKQFLALSNSVPATASYIEEENVLQQEDGFDILLEDGNKIELE